MEYSDLTSPSHYSHPMPDITLIDFVLTDDVHIPGREIRSTGEIGGWGQMKENVGFTVQTQLFRLFFSNLIVLRIWASYYYKLMVCHPKTF